MSGQISETPVLTALSELVSRRVDGKDEARARLHLLDWIGCAVAGAGEPTGQVLKRQAPQTASDYAFVWGGLGNILEMDDVDKRALLHPGPSIMPSALATTHDVEAEMSDLLSAIVRGYEATIRLGRAVGPAHYALWHSTGTCGAIGAAAAAASLRSLDTDQTAHAMALAMSQSAGLWHTRHDPESMGKQLHTSNAARAGYDAARLARDGFRGPLRILEGAQGFFDAMCPDGDPQNILARPDSDWRIHDDSFKPWPACRHAHAVIDAALELRAATDLAGDRMFTVQTYGDALKFCDKPMPNSVIEAKFSLQHCVAICLLNGEPTLDDFSPDAIKDPEVAALRQRVTVEIGPDFEARYPARFGASVADGETTVSVDDALGDPENPVSVKQIQSKADSLMNAGGLAAEDRTALVESVMSASAAAKPVIKLIAEALS